MSLTQQEMAAANKEYHKQCLEALTTLESQVDELNENLLLIKLVSQVGTGVEKPGVCKIMYIGDTKIGIIEQSERYPLVRPCLDIYGMGTLAWSVSHLGPYNLMQRCSGPVGVWDAWDPHPGQTRIHKHGRQQWYVQSPS
jgi:hypothetical protein